MIMKLIKIFDVHDKQFMFKQRVNDKMIEWWKKTMKKCYFMFKIIRSYFHMRRVSSYFSWSLIYVFNISFSSNEFFLHCFRQTTRISFVFHSILRQTYEFDKLIDEHVSYSSLDSEKISLLRALCLIFFFWNSKRFTTRKKKRFHWQFEKRKNFIDIN
jgi:hypothetical protein